MAGFNRSLSYKIIQEVAYISAWKGIPTLVANSCGKLGKSSKKLRCIQFKQKAYILHMPHSNLKKYKKEEHYTGIKLCSNPPPTNKSLNNDTQ
jgi:hypothetical protein